MPFAFWSLKASGETHLFAYGRVEGARWRAVVEALGYQTRDLIAAMRADWPVAAGAATVLRVDGGMTASDLTLQFLADILDAPVASRASSCAGPRPCCFPSSKRRATSDAAQCGTEGERSSGKSC